MPRKKKLKVDRFCKNTECGILLEEEWAEPNQIYCSLKCLNRVWYLQNKKHHQQLYLIEKKRWERSPTGKRVGLAIRNWINLPEEFK